MALVKSSLEVLRIKELKMKLKENPGDRQTILELLEVIGCKAQIYNSSFNFDKEKIDFIAEIGAVFVPPPAGGRRGLIEAGAKDGEGGATEEVGVQRGAKVSDRKKVEGLSEEEMTAKINRHITYAYRNVEGV